MLTIDAVLQPNDRWIDLGREALPPDVFELARDISVRKLDDTSVRTVFDLGDPRGFQAPSAFRQGWYLYAFVCEVPGPASVHEWDSDQRLQTAIALSRLVHQTSISFRYAARLQYGDKGNLICAFPAVLRGVDPDSWLAPREGYRDWLIEPELKELRQLIERRDSRKLPLRVSRSLWYHEYAARTYYGEVRWLLVCTALESLLNTCEYYSGMQFRCRVPHLALEVGRNITEDEAGEAWKMRSHLSHGGATGKLNSQEEEVYIKLENTLGSVLKRAILDDTFSSTFADESSIRKKWPISRGGKSI